jgi:hypothetical protein
MISSLPSNLFPRISSFMGNPKNGSRKEPDPSCKVEEAGQSTEALWWPLGYPDLCVASHCRGEEALLSHLYGDQPPGNASLASSELCFGTHVTHRLHFESSLLRYYLAGNIATTCKNAEQLKPAPRKILFLFSKTGPRK